MNADESFARRLLSMWCRQFDGYPLPAKVPVSPALLALVDEATAQRIWDELLAKLKK